MSGRVEITLDPVAGSSQHLARQAVDQHGANRNLTRRRRRFRFTDRPFHEFSAIFVHSVKVGAEHEIVKRARCADVRPALHSRS